MRQEEGNRDSPIWLLGDSPPLKWQDRLRAPLDSLHPARHNIWTPVLDAIQETAFSANGRRVDASALYVRNAADDVAIKPPATAPRWDARAQSQVAELGLLLKRHRPPVLHSFGAFAFEVARRALGEEPLRAYGYWQTGRLGGEFRERMERFDVHSVNLLPLLHVSIARGQFLKSHANFCATENANYFEFVGRRIGVKLVQHEKDLEIWI